MLRESAHIGGLKKKHKKITWHKAVKPYEFNHTHGFDVPDLPDNNGVEFMFFNIVDMGTGFGIVALLSADREHQHLFNART